MLLCLSARSTNPWSEIGSNQCIWADCGDDHPFGICLDAEGVIWYADVGKQHCVRVSNQRCARVCEGGDVLQIINLDRGGFACMLGGVNKRTLFIMASQWAGTENSENSRVHMSQMLAIDVSVPDVGWPEENSFLKVAH